jgi:site-specific DNA recombinase
VIAKLSAEEYFPNRIKKVVSKLSILKDIVRTENKRKKQQIKPLSIELDAINQAVLDLEQRRKKYLDLYEEEVLDRELFSSRLEEIKEERERLLL